MNQYILEIKHYGETINEDTLEIKSYANYIY